MIPPLAHPARTAQIVRDLIAELRAAGYEVVTVAELEAAVDRLEACGWELPKHRATVVERFSGNGHTP